MTGRAQHGAPGSWRRHAVPPGHAALTPSTQGRAFVKLDSPTRREFSDHELAPLREMLEHSMANDRVHQLIHEALAWLPDYWIRAAGVYLPELGSPIRYLAIGPTGAFIIAPSNGAWRDEGLLELERAAAAIDRRLPSRKWSGTRLRLVFDPGHPTLRAQVMGVPGMRRIHVLAATDLHSHLQTHPGHGPCQGDLNALRKLASSFPTSGANIRARLRYGGDVPNPAKPLFDD